MVIHLFGRWEHTLSYLTYWYQALLPTMFEIVCRVAVRDSGKAMVDAAFGELMVTCEKIDWLVKDGERHLRPETRAPGAMVRLPLTFTCRLVSNCTLTCK